MITPHLEVLKISILDPKYAKNNQSVILKVWGSQGPRSQSEDEIIQFK